MNEHMGKVSSQFTCEKLHRPHICPCQPRVKAYLDHEKSFQKPEHLGVSSHTCHLQAVHFG